MTINDQPCSSCTHYAPISIGDGQKKASRGWCVTKSVYPAQEQPGQIIPPGAARAPAGELARPHIVVGAEVVGHCAEFHAAPVRPSKKK